ncbi:hypothetical protein [Streptomyces sp. NPDC059708]|uniref:hypothetical protein n=1 Tax=Streptomyces sp. NPDC059708 TaxID=3346916 RepID=UPI003674D9DA
MTDNDAPRMWIEAHCGQCGNGYYVMEPGRTFFLCTEPTCHHTLDPRDLVDVDAWMIRDGLVFLQVLQVG